MEWMSQWKWDNLCGNAFKMKIARETLFWWSQHLENCD